MFYSDYDRALHHTLWGEWDDLLVLMVRTQDELLSKRIEFFLHAFHYHLGEQELLESHESLLHYIDHAMAATQPMSVT
nr:YhdB family protein [Thalassobacillus sp. CUG 92003]